MEPWTLLEAQSEDSHHSCPLQNRFFRALGWSGLAWAGLGWPGLAWAGLSSPGLAWAGLGWPELAWAGLSELAWELPNGALDAPGGSK